MLVGVIAGLLASLVRAWWGGHPLLSPSLRLIGLVPLAFLPQWLAFYLPATRTLIANHLAASTLIGSQVLLLIFAWFNRDRPGFWLLGLGLALNLLVIALNGGLMPISPETAMQLVPTASIQSWQIGGRLGTGKDIVLATATTRVEWLSDRFLLPEASPYHVAFSLGDILVAVGAFRFLWALGGKSQETQGATR